MGWKVFDNQGRFLVNLNSGPAAGPVYTLFQDGIVAKAGGVQGNAVNLIAIYNFVDTVATNGDCVIVLPAIKNTIQVIQNRGAADLYVFPYFGDKFYGLAANASKTVVNGSTLSIGCSTNGTWDIIP